MDLMVSNLTVSAHHAFVRAVTVNAQSESSDSDVIRTNRTRVENSFITLMILVSYRRVGDAGPLLTDLISICFARPRRIALVSIFIACSLSLT